MLVESSVKSRYRYLYPCPCLKFSVSKDGNSFCSIFLYITHPNTKWAPLMELQQALSLCLLLCLPMRPPRSQMPIRAWLRIIIGKNRGHARTSGRNSLLNCFVNRLQSNALGFIYQIGLRALAFNPPAGSLGGRFRQMSFILRRRKNSSTFSCAHLQLSNKQRWI